MTGKLPLTALALLVFACSGEKHNPVVPGPGPQPPADQVTVEVTADVSQVHAGTAATTLRVVARRGDGTPPADGTEATVNTSLGSFGTAADGAPVRLVRTPLTGGVADVRFFPGSETGVANILAQVGTSVGRFSLTIMPMPPAPVADFTFAANGLKVLFTDASTGGPVSRRWQFGDGNESSEASPTHTYSSAGTYTVTLTVANAAGEAARSRFVTVSVGEPPRAAFAFEVSGRSVHFVDRSTGASSWSWNFGDGTTSSERNPIHLYGRPDAYTVTLTVANAAGSNSISEVVTISPGPAPEAAFAFEVAGRTVHFVDRTTGGPTFWSWDFGDGSTAYVQNPTHTYAAAGKYTVVLLTSNAAGSSKASHVVTVQADAAPVAAFDFTVAGAQVNFVDRSTGAPASWSWSFGDGAGSTQQNPVHAYTAPGSYTVTLTVANAGGSSSKSHVVTIAPGAPPQAEFEFTVSNLQVNFVDRSTGGPTSWHWNFGDGRTSTQRNPVHLYPAAGTYTVTLTVSNASGQTSKAKAVTTTHSPP